MTYESHVPDARRRALLATPAALGLWSRAAPAQNTSSLLVLAQDREGRPLQDVVVYVPVPNHGTEPPRRPAVMAQRDFVFDPFVLVIQTGTDVVFPNQDRVEHHVRSLGGVNDFELPVYGPKTVPKPVRMPATGVTPLSCHFHGSMRGYVVTVDTPFFARTDEHGSARIEGLPSGTFEVRGWHPDWIRPHLAQTVAFTGGAQNATLRFDLRPHPRPTPRKRAPAGSAAPAGDYDYK